MYDLYRCNEDDSVRFILGKDGINKLFVVGLNPSTANKEESDITVAKVETVAKNNGYDGFVMVNLYPQRSTNPNRLPEKGDDGLIIKNIEIIEALAKNQNMPVFWAAWGNGIVTRSYLIKALNVLTRKIRPLGAEWVHYGELTKYGHPKHPSRLSYSWVFSDFDVVSYVQNVA
jgi:hypothetical protein